MLTGHRRTVRDGSNKVDETDYSYDAYGNALTKTRKCLTGCPGGSGDATTTYTYDSNGQAASKKDPNQNTTGYSYMCSDTYLSQITNPDNTTENFNYDCPSGELLLPGPERGNNVVQLYATMYRSARSAEPPWQDQLSRRRPDKLLL